MCIIYPQLFIIDQLPTIYHHTNLHRLSADPINIIIGTKIIGDMADIVMVRMVDRMVTHILILTTIIIINTAIEIGLILIRNIIFFQHQPELISPKIGVFMVARTAMVPLIISITLDTRVTKISIIGDLINLINTKNIISAIYRQVYRIYRFRHQNQAPSTLHSTNPMDHFPLTILIILYYQQNHVERLITIF